MPSLDTLLKELPKAEPKPELLEGILISIRKQKQLKKIKVAMGVFSSGFALTMGLMAIFWDSFMYEIASSPFRDYLNLLMTDSGSLSHYWRQVTLSLLESMPVYNLMAWLLAAFFGFGLLSKTYEFFRSKRINNFYGTKPHIA